MHNDFQGKVCGACAAPIFISAAAAELGQHRPGLAACGPARMQSGCGASLGSQENVWPWTLLMLAARRRTSSRTRSRATTWQ